MYVFTLLSLVSISLKLTQSLEAVTLNQRLPSPRTNLKALFDGDDSIFLLGGSVHSDVISDEVLQFSLSTEEMQVVGRFPDKISFGSAQFASGNIFYFGGRPASGGFSSNIWATNQKQLNPYPAAKMSDRIVGICSAYDGVDSVYIFGGVNHNLSDVFNIQKFNINNGTTDVVSTLPYGIFDAAAVWFNNSAYVFGGMQGVNPNKYIAKFTPSAQENQLEILPVEMPVAFATGSALTDGKYIYLIYGFHGNQSTMVIFDPNTLNFTMENVTNLEGVNGASVYVAKTNRIYVFGGYYGIPYEPLDKIRYIKIKID